MTTNIHYLIAGMAVLLVVIWQYSRQRQMDDRNSRMFRRLLSVVSLDVAAELVSTGFILYAPYSFNICRMLSNTVFYLFQALLPLLLLYYVCTLCTSRVIAVTMLEEAGFAVDTAENGKLAVDKVRESAPGYYDLVLMDIQMPVMNGYEATRAIRALPDAEKAALPIVAITANAFDEDRQNAAKAGMNGHLSKPFDMQQLLAMIEEVL